MADPHEIQHETSHRPDLHLVAKDGVQVEESFPESYIRIVQNQAHFPLDQLREYDAVHPVDSGTIIDFSCAGEQCAVSFSSQVMKEDTEKQLSMRLGDAHQLFGGLPTNGNFEQGVKEALSGGSVTVWNFGAGQPAGIEFSLPTQAAHLPQ